MIKMNITVDSDLLQQLANRLPSFAGQQAAPATSAAFETSTQLIRETWRGWAIGGPLKGVANIKRPSPSLYASIEINQTGPFNATIESSSPYAQRIQDGTPELDMKKTHTIGPKSRVSRDGKSSYLIVPFRWGTPNEYGGARAHFGNVIPQSVYPMAEAMEKSFILEKRADGSKAVHVEKNAMGQDVERPEYQWGDRLQAGGNMNGMVRMGKETKGGGSTYYTFRVISTKQIITNPDKWIRKAVEPVDVVGAVESVTRPLVEGIIEAGMRADMGI